MFSHVMVGTNDLEKAKAFYDALFTSIGGREAITDPNVLRAMQEVPRHEFLPEPFPLVNGEQAI